MTVFNGTDGKDKIIGDPVADVINTFEKNDKVYAGDGDDTVDAGDGSDRVEGEAGNDSILGGDGKDALYGGADNDYVYGGQGKDRVEGGDGDDELLGGIGADKLYGDDGNDVMYGDDGLGGGTGGKDLMYGGDGNDTMYGEAGNDRMRGEDGNDYLDGGEGDDRLFGGDGADELHGGEGEDDLNGGKGNDVMYGDAYDDTLDGQRGSDTLYGGDGDDELDGGKGDDLIYGNDDDDDIFGHHGADTLYGNDGNDSIDGHKGADSIEGNDGDDYIKGGKGADTIQGNLGNDYIDGEQSNDLILHDLDYEAADSDEYQGDRGIDTVRWFVTQDTWFELNLQDDREGFLNHKDGVPREDHDNEVDNDPTTLDNWDLTLGGFEHLEIAIDTTGATAHYDKDAAGVLFLDNVDVYDDDVTLVADTMTVGEDDIGATAFAGSVLDNDDVPDWVFKIELDSGPANGVLAFTGGDELNPTQYSTAGLFTFDVNGDYEHLGVGESYDETFVYKVTDADRDVATQTVTITVEGANDDVSATGGDVTGSVTEDGTLTANGTLTWSDVDTNDTHTWSGDATGTYGSISVNDDGEWTYTLDNADADLLTLDDGDSAIDSFTLTVSDGNGSTDTIDVDITVNGADEGNTIDLEDLALGGTAGVNFGPNFMYNGLNVYSLQVRDMDHADFVGTGTEGFGDEQVGIWMDAVADGGHGDFFDFVSVDITTGAVGDVTVELYSSATNTWTFHTHSSAVAGVTETIVFNETDIDQFKIKTSGDAVFDDLVIG